MGTEEIKKGLEAAFITLGGIKPLLLTLKELEKRNIKGKILTTNYMTFSDPKALEELSAFKNIDLRLYYVKDGEPGFHTKGYIFKKGDIYKMITGSSNLTANALTRNKEWNIKVISTSEGDYYVSLMKEFSELWEKATPLDDIVDMYKKIYSEQKALWKRAKVPSLESYKLKPNDMQVQFSNNLKKLIDNGEKRALLVSSTGERVIIVTGRRSPVKSRACVA